MAGTLRSPPAKRNPRPRRARIPHAPGEPKIHPAQLPGPASHHGSPERRLRAPERAVKGAREPLRRPTRARTLRGLIARLGQTPQHQLLLLKLGSDPRTFDGVKCLGV